jgi:hypothetical protein
MVCTCFTFEETASQFSKVVILTGHVDMISLFNISHPSGHVEVFYHGFNWNFPMNNNVEHHCAYFYLHFFLVEMPVQMFFSLILLFSLLRLPFSLRGHSTNQNTGEAHGLMDRDQVWVDQVYLDLNSASAT